MKTLTKTELEKILEEIIDEGIKLNL